MSDQAHQWGLRRILRHHAAKRELRGCRVTIHLPDGSVSLDGPDVLDPDAVLGAIREMRAKRPNPLDTEGVSYE